MTNLTSSTLVPTALTDLLYAVHANSPLATSSKGTINWNHPIITQNPEILTHLTTVSEALGTDLETIEEILFFMVDDTGKLKTFVPCVKAFEDEVCIVWGKFTVALSRVAPTFVGDKYVGAEFDIDGLDVLVPVRLNEENKGLTRQTVKKLFLAGDLAPKLQTRNAGGVYAQSIVNLEAGMHIVTSAVETVGFNKSVGFNIVIGGVEYKAPKKVISLLTAFGADKVTEETPWALHLGELVTTEIGGRTVTYRQVNHISTHHNAKMDLTSFTFETVANVKVPSSLLSLDA